MSFMDKVKDFGEEIKKTVEDSDIKDKAKSAGRIITDAVEKGKKGIETKLEENRLKAEAEKEIIRKLQNAIFQDIENNYNNNSLLTTFDANITLITNFVDEYYEKIITLSSNYKCGDFTLGRFIASKHTDNILAAFNKNDIEEEVENSLICYYRNNKEYFLLTDKSLYYKGINNTEKKVISGEVENKYLQNISIVKNNEISILKINNVDTIIINCNNISIINKCLERIAEGNLTITENDISEEIKSQISTEVNEKINEIINEEEYFTFSSKKINYNSNDSNMVCTNTRVIIISNKDKNEGGVVNTINYEDIVYIGLENGTVPIISLLQDLVIEIIVDGSKQKIDKLNRAQAQRVIFLINKYKREIENNGSTVRYEDIKDEIRNEVDVVLKVAKKLLEKGQDINFVAEVTELPIEKIEELNEVKLIGSDDII